MTTILITGGSSGIGYQLSNQLADEGHDVDATFKETECSSNKPNLNYHRLNVLDEKIDFDFLPEQIDGLIYCPGSVNLKVLKK